MESKPKKSESDTEKRTSGKSSKKRAETLGALLVEPAPEKPTFGKDRKTLPESSWLFGGQEDGSKEKTTAINNSAETAEVSEAEAPLEDIGPEEAREIRRRSAEAGLKAVQEQPVQPGQAPEDALGDLLVEDYLTQMADGGVESEIALQNTIAKTGLSAEELSGLDGFLVEEDSEAEQAKRVAAESETDQLPETEEEAAHEIWEEEAEIPLNHEPLPPEAEDDDSAVAGGSGTPPPPPLRPAASSGAGSGAGASGQPISSFANQGPAYNVVPSANSANQGRSPESYFWDGAIIGGIIGYLIGRRRGRIKTEKKLLPVQKKLEKKVKALQGELEKDAFRLRKLAAERVQAQGPVAIEKFKTATRSESRAVTRSEYIEPLSVRERQKAPEAHQLHGSSRAPEHLGRMVVVAEAKPEQGGESPQPAVAESARATVEAAKLNQDKNVQTMNRAELMNLSDKIIIEGASLRQIYESHLIGERGLRRLVAEYLRGGNVKKVLRREIVEREIDFERDPAMRDRPGQAVSTGGGSHADLNQLLEKAGASLPESDEEVAFYRARAAYEANEQVAQKQRRRLVDTSMTVIIVVLVAVVALLLLTR